MGFTRFLDDKSTLHFSYVKWILFLIFAFLRKRKTGFTELGFWKTLIIIFYSSNFFELHNRDFFCN